MSTKYEMVEITLYEDGTWEIKDIDSSHVTQKLYCALKGRFGTLYYCRKEKAYYYLKKLFKELIAKNKNKIKELEKRNEILLEQLSNFKKDFEGGN